ncbi:RNA-binding cell elongation regulator Jag/EloR [Candidatus Poriferisocius sp.]|uniref:RNA-binding cell elongation regulator Jag/EloR n=1 Tax=Candidatus Poriferisocius sp. TaxID=3101276 RepID=UPI003B5267F8
MEWLEVTGKTIAQAEEAALDRLGVDRSEAEFSVVDEPKSALLGLRRTEARIRARVRPVLPREKRNRRPSNKRDRNRSRKSEQGNLKEDRNRGSRGAQGQNRSSGASNRERSQREPQHKKPQNASKTNRGAGKDRPTNAPEGDQARKSKPMEDQMSLQEQSTLVVEFLDGLLDAFELDAEVYAESVDDETMEMRVENTEGVGLLIGPKGNTLRAVEDLSRMLVQRKSDGNCEGRIRVDIGGYRERRRAALESFCEKIALEVRETGADRPLEPMNAADRKVVHDVVAEIDGVGTVSEGQEPRRWVVIIPN